ncbi:MAG: alkaline phosphatase family protein [Gaiellales bacterium]
MRRVGGFAAVAGAAGLMAVCVVASLAASNLIANGTFEGAGSGSLAGWAASGGSIALVAGDGGGHAAEVTANASASKVYAYTSTKPVKSTAAGVTYDLAGALRGASAGQTVCLLLKEQPAGSTQLVGSAQQCLTTTTDWQNFPAVVYTTAAAGDQLTVNVAEAAPATHAAYDIDNLSLTVAGTDTSPPSVPQNVAASSSASTTADVSWDASTDNVGVAGYDVLRDGVRVTSVGGTQTSFHDSGLQPSTTYSYTVDAFDGAGNTSQQSQAALATTGAGGGGGGGGACGILAPAATPPVYQHVIVIMDENLGYATWHGSSQAPYTNALAAQCALATNAVGATHPSQPNYLAITSGQLQVWTGSAKHSSADNLFHQLGVAGMGWTALEEGMSSNCSATSALPYKTGHNPPFWYTDLASAGGGDGSCARDDVPFAVSGFDPAGAPDFTWITPNQCNDMHWVTGCPGTKTGRIQVGDTWLQGLLPQIFQTTDYQQGRTMVLLTWDEGNESGSTGIDCTTQSNIDSSGCHVGLLAMSAWITPGTLDATRYSDYSVLASIESMWNLPLLGRAQTAKPLGPAMGF